MLVRYEADYYTAMDIKKILQLLYDYTSDYPFLVSRLCKLMDEKKAETDTFPGEVQGGCHGSGKKIAFRKEYII